MVGERLEEVEVASVDERHLDRAAPHLRHSLEPAEATTNHDDSMQNTGALGSGVSPRRENVDGFGDALHAAVAERLV